MKRFGGQKDAGMSLAFRNAVFPLPSARLPSQNTVLEAGESEIKVSADLVPGGRSPPSLWMPTVSSYGGERGLG